MGKYFIIYVRYMLYMKMILSFFYRAKGSFILGETKMEILEEGSRGILFFRRRVC